MKKIILLVILAILGLGVLYVVVSIISPKPENPPVVSEPQWDSPRTRELAKRACFDCHSNETVWPWYSNIVPVASLLRNDVREGRSMMNFSEWNRPQEIESDEVKEVIEEGAMPPPPYLLMHPLARLTAQEKQELIQGLLTTLSR